MKRSEIELLIHYIFLEKLKYTQTGNNNNNNNNNYYY